MTTQVERRPSPTPSRGDRGWIRRNWAWLCAGGVVVAAGLAWLAFGYFAVHTLFIDERVDEAAPVFASGADTAIAPATTAPVATAPVATAPATTVPATTAPATTAPVATAPTTTAPPQQAQVATVAEGTFISRDHPTSGRALVLNDGTTQRFLRLEDFETDNGPDVNVYLTRADAAAPSGELGADYVDLGDLKGNIGNQNYEIPPPVDLSAYDTVVIWCVRFSVPFGAADLVVGNVPAG